MDSDRQVAPRSEQPSSAPATSSEFYRNWTTRVAWGLAALVGALNGVANLGSHNLGYAAGWFLACVACTAYTIWVVRVPYVVISASDLIVSEAFFRRVVPWKTVRGATLGSWGKLNVAYGDGSTIAIDLRGIKESRRDELVAEVERLAGAKRG